MPAQPNVSRPHQPAGRARSEPTTADLVYEVVAAIPPRRVLSYGDVAALAGIGSARIAGRVLASGAEPVPWHRVVHADGTCAAPVRARQLSLLRAEGTPMRGDRVDLAAARFDSTRLELDSAGLEPGQAAAWLTTSVVPQPVAWVSTRSTDGVDAVSPHPVTAIAGSDPPTLCFTSVDGKDSLRNARATGEFVVCMGTESLLADMVESGTPFPSGLSEFDLVGLIREPSAVVRPARVAHAPVAFECRVSGEYQLGARVLVFGEVVHIAATNGVLAADGRPDPVILAPVARLGRNHWWRRGEVVALDRIDWAQWQAGVRSAEPEPPPQAT